MKCTHNKENWEICKAFAMKGTEFCYLHNPEIPEDEKKEAQSKWWKSGIKQLSSKTCAPIIIKEIWDISELLIDTINQVRGWEMDVKTANCIGFLSNHLMKAYEITNLEHKIEAIKESLSIHQ